MYVNICRWLKKKDINFFSALQYLWSSYIQNQAVSIDFRKFLQKQFLGRKELVKKTLASDSGSRAMVSGSSLNMTLFKSTKSKIYLDKGWTSQNLSLKWNARRMKNVIVINAHKKVSFILIIIYNQGYIYINLYLKTLSHPWDR